ncbi:uncharacterized protein VSU04_000629 isoform 3-T3 [Chlamydotis macqueenii]
MTSRTIYTDFRGYFLRKEAVSKGTTGIATGHPSDLQVVSDDSDFPAPVFQVPCVFYKDLRTYQAQVGVTSRNEGIPVELIAVD